MATSSTYSTSNQYIKYRIIVDELSTSIPNNTSSVRVRVQAWRTNSGYTTDAKGTCYATIDGTSYSQSWAYGSKPITYNSYTTLFDKTVTISHNADGAKTIYVSSYIKHDKFSSSSHGFNVTLTTIPRKATITAAPNFNDTDNPTISYTNAAGNTATSVQACISLDNSTDTIAYRDIDKLGTSYTFTLSASDRTTLLNATPNDNSLTVYFIIKTELGGNIYYSSVQKTMFVTDADPVFGTVTYADINASTVAITSDDQKIIQNKSKVQFSFTSITAQKGADLASLKIEINAQSLYDTISGSSIANYTLNFNEIDSAADETAEITVYDTRGNSTTTTVSITMLAWSAPTAVISLGRVNNFYSETDLKVQATYSDLDGSNSLTIQYQYKELPSGSYNAATTISDNTTYQIVLANTKEWMVKITLTDLIGSNTYELMVPKGTPIMYIDKLRSSVGINCIPNNDNALEVNGVDTTQLLSHLMAFSYQNTDTFVFEMPFEVDASHMGSIMAFAGTQVLAFGMASTSPYINNILSEPLSISLDADNKTFTITAQNVVTGVMTILIGI